MPKKNKIVKSPANSFPGFGDQRFAQIMEMLKSSGRPAVTQSVFRDIFGGGEDTADLESSPGDMQQLRKWFHSAEKLHTQFPKQFHPDLIRFDVDFDIEGLFADGLIVAQMSFESDDDSYRLFVNLDPQTTSHWGCECLESMDSKPCQHTYIFVDWLCAMLDEYEEFDHSIADRIAENDFDTQRPDLTQLGQHNIEESLTAFLQKHLPKIDSLPKLDPAVLSPIDTTTPMRLCWDLTPNNQNPVIQLRVQTQKKRGKGWTKGRQVSPDSLVGYAHLATDADTKVLARLDEGQYHYRNLSFNVADSLRLLIGQPNVMINGQPAEVRRLQPELEYFQDAENCGVRQKSSVVSGSGFLLHRRHLFVEINPTELIAQVAELPDETAHLYKALRTLPKMPVVMAGELINRLRTYQDAISIHLPDDARSTIHETTSPVLLLRSQKNGLLDYGFRCRGSQGHLYAPGTGLTVVNVTANQTAKNSGDETVGDIRLVRHPNEEMAQVQRVAASLNLPAEPMENSLADFDEALDLLDRAQQLESSGGLEVLWDKNSADPVKVLGTVSAKGLRVNVSQDRDWFQLNGECDLGNGTLNLSDLLSGLGDGETNGQYVRFGKHGWAKVSQQLRGQLNRLADSVNRDRKKLNFDASSVPALREILADQIQLEDSQAWDDCLARVQRAQNLVPVVPAALNAELRQYQTEGFCWLRRLAEWGIGGILADDMGLGKTVQTLGVLLDRAAGGPALVVAPTSVGFNWQAEAQRFAPDLNVHLYRETDRDAFLSGLGPQDLVICSYGLMLRDVAKLSSVSWSTMVLDEAQAVKNNRSKTAAAAKKITADWKLALTGTPMENHLGELWSIFNVVAPGVFGGWENFRSRFASPIERDQNEERRLALRDRIQPFILRRTKSEVLKDLPPRSEQNITVELSPAERKIYDRVRLSAVGEIDEIAGLPNVQDQRFRLLALLTRLRQLACSPKLVDETWSGRSSKLQQLAETLLELKQEGHRVLIFSQFVKHLALIREMMVEEQISFEYLDGSTPAKARQEGVERFQNGDATAFLISLKAGGTGLNLTAADYVIHMDPWWNPAVEDQATDRAHRIGQQRPVMCYRFVSQGTIEEEILKLHDSKRDLVAGILEGSSAAAKLSTADLIKLIR